MDGLLAPLVRREQGDDLAIEPVPRGDQESDVDQHEHRVGQDALDALGDAAEVLGRIERAQGFGDCGRRLQTEPRSQRHHLGVQPRAVVDQLADEAAGVVDQEVDGQAEQDHGHDHRHGCGGVGGHSRDGPLQRSRQGVDQH